MEASHHPFYVGDWLVEPRLYRVTGAEQSSDLEPKVMHVLVCLAEHAGILVERHALLDRIWGDTIVTDHVLNRSISQLRKVFHDDPRDPRYIETIPKSGYRLIAPVRPSPEMLPVRLLYGQDGSDGEASAATHELSLSLSIPSPHLPVSAKGSRRLITALLSLSVLLTGALVGTWVHSQDGSDAQLYSRPLTSLPGLELQPALSPDGKAVAFVWNDAERTNPDIFVKIIGTDSQVRLTDNPARDILPTWSPDGRFIAFRRHEGSSCSLLVIPAFGGTERVLSDCEGAEYSLSWSPTSDWLAVAGRDGPNAPPGIRLINVQTDERRTLTRPPHPAMIDLAPRFSPDGSTIAFIRSGSSPGLGDVYVLDVAGEQPPRRLTFENRYITGLTWSPGGEDLLISSNRTGTFRIWRVPVAGGEATPVANVNTFDPGQLSVSPSSNRLVYEEWYHEMNVWALPIGSPADSLRPPRQVIASTQWDFHPCYSPSGDRIAFISNRSGSFELWISDADGSDPVRLTSFGGAFVEEPQWSPDGQYLVFTVHDEDHAQLYLLDPNRGRTRRLTQEPVDHVNPSWSRDGRWVYFASNQGGNWNTWKAPIGEGAPVQITTSGGFFARESWDGSRLLFTRYDEDGLWQRPLAGIDPETLLLSELSAADLGNWTVGADGIYFIRRTPNGPVLAQFDAQQQTSRVVHSLDAFRKLPAPGLSLSPDGQWLLLTHADRVDSDLYLVEGFR